MSQTTNNTFIIKKVDSIIKCHKVLNGSKNRLPTDINQVEFPDLNI